MKRGVRILVVATKAPWPPIDGGRLLLLRTIEGLASAGATVTLVAPVDVRCHQLARVAAELAPICVPRLVAARPAGPVLTLARMLAGRPLSIARHTQPALRRQVERLLAAAPAGAPPFDVVHAEQLQALPQLLRPARAHALPVVLRAQNVESSLWAAAGSSPLWAWEARRLASWEGRAVAACNATAALTAIDAVELSRLATLAQGQPKASAPASGAPASAGTVAEAAAAGTTDAQAFASGAASGGGAATDPGFAGGAASGAAGGGAAAADPGFAGFAASDAAGGGGAAADPGFAGGAASGAAGGGAAAAGAATANAAAEGAAGVAAGRVVVLPAPFAAELPAGRAGLGGAPAVVVLGSLGWRPNQDALQWFIGEIWPAVRGRLPEALLHVFGVSRPTTLAARARGGGRPPAAEPGGIEWHPAPADSAMAFAAGSVHVVPLRFGSGVRMKVLEAWARGVPVVTTPQGAAGLEARDGAELLVARDAASFAAALERLHGDPRLAAALVRGGRAALRQRHDPATLAQRLLQIYKDVQVVTSNAAPAEPAGGADAASGRPRR